MKRTLIKAAIAGLLIAVSGLTAWSLSVDQTRTMEQRYFGYQMSHYYRITINWNDPGRGTAQKFGAMGKNAFISKVSCYVTTAFDGTPTLSLGTSTTATEIMATSGAGASVDLTSATYQNATSAAGLGQKVTSANDIILYSKFSATAGTVGLASCVIEYMPNNDL